MKMAKAFMKFEMPKDLVDKVLEAVTIAKATGKISKGVNETTKAIERGVAKLVVMAEDVTPEEVLMHLPVICEEKEVPYAYVPNKIELGKASGIDVPTSSIAVTEEGESKKLIAEIAAKVNELKK
jgi:large subunit ribosomal protein L7Ae